MCQEVYMCGVCDKTFKNKRGVRLHNQKFHPEMFDYKCGECGYLSEDLKGLMIHVNKKHNSKEYFDKYLLGNEKCRYTHCNNNLTYENRYSGSYCSKQHYESQKQINDGVDLKYKCDVCDSMFIDLGGLQQHLSKVHSYDYDKLKEYYDKYFKKDGDGFCVYCGDVLKFKGFSDGYPRFCYNTECNVKWHNKNTGRLEKFSKTKKQNMIDHPECVNTKIEFWLNKGYSENVAKEKLKERQTTFSKDICIEKYGEGKGLEVWKERQEKWIKSLPKQNYSKISQDLFWLLYNNIKDNFDDIYFASLNGGICDYTRNKEYRIETKSTYRLLDFYIKDNDRCVEFDGTYWHGEIGRGNRTLDANRDEEIINANPDIEILHIKEKDYNNNKDKVIKECLEFING